MAVTGRFFLERSWAKKPPRLGLPLEGDEGGAVPLRRGAVPVLVCFVHTTGGPQSANIGQVGLTWAAGATRRMAASARPPDITSTTALCFPSTHLFLFQHRLATAEYHHHPQHRRQRGIRRFATAIQQRPNSPPHAHGHIVEIVEHWRSGTKRGSHRRLHNQRTV